MKNYQDEIIGVLQLINARDRQGATIPFGRDLQPIVEAFASQAAVALDNQHLIEAQKGLIDSFVKVIAGAIDAKSPYTGGHCQRVPALTQMIVQAACDAQTGQFAEFGLDDEEWYELHLASWLHDCGKITTPDFVMDKATKLECINNRIHEIRTRFEVLRRDAEIEMWQTIAKGGDEFKARRAFAVRCRQLEDDFAFVAKSNIGGEYMDPDAETRLRQIGKQKWTRYFDRSIGLSWREEMVAREHPPSSPPALERLLDDRLDHRYDVYNTGELYNLSVTRGTLTDEERKTINDHIVVTQDMLGRLPFPKTLKRIPEYAGNHHEHIDGSGYPNGLTGDQMSLPAKAMAISDVFEALTARDRPYKRLKRVSEALHIMHDMVRRGHLDPALFGLFLASGAYRNYAEQYLDPEQIDDVDLDDFGDVVARAAE